ncbi:hypothetical protein [Streptomyces sp. NPDC002580]|uniref:hypothetical protein n=1 Tax=Streptomyces sp. NPDC002580 TaxID=3364653 RepID=UPI00367A9D50
MISTRRITAAVGLAVGVTGLAAPMAAASGPAGAEAAKPNLVTALDPLAVSDVPVERQAGLPRPSARLAGLDRLSELNRLRRLTDVAAPATGLLGGIQS